MPAIESIREIIRHQHDMAMYEEQIRAMENMVGELSRSGQIEKMRQSLTSILAEVKRIEDPYWREYYVSKIESKWGTLIIREGINFFS